MIGSFRPHAAGIGAALCITLACRDAPTSADAGREPIRVSADLVSDTINEIPAVAAQVVWGTTTIFFYDGRYGGDPYARFTGDMEYIGNRASMDIKYSIRGDEPDIDDHLSDEQSRVYSPLARHRFTRSFDVATHKKCDLTLNASTTHQAWWSVWIPIAPSWKSTKGSLVSRAPTLQTDFCPAPEDPGDDSGGSTSGLGYITIETCYYWAHYVNGVLVSIELRYCEYDTIPVADE